MSLQFLEPCSKGLGFFFFKVILNSVCMCLVDRSWEGNIPVTEKQPTCLMSISEIVAVRMWVSGAVVLYGV